MTPAEFLRFRTAMARKMDLDVELLSERKTAELLGAGRYQVHRWSEVGTPPYVDYACQAILERIKT